ncbi:MAG: PepSY-associated TM helix domain-containing protein, partial [Bacteroidota bacterium]
TDWYYQEMVFVPTVGERMVPPSSVLRNLNAEHDGPEFLRINISSDPQRAWVLTRFQSAEKKGFWWWDGIVLSERWYVDPYTGETLGVVDLRRDWIRLCRHLHQNLLINSKVGTKIIGIAALIMIVLALSGLYLWWPKNLRMLRQRLKIKWSASWKRLNWDLHSVSGFYTHILILFFASTGLVWAFDWWSDGVYRMLGDNPETVFMRPAGVEMEGGPELIALDIAFEDTKRRQLQWEQINLRLTKAEQAKALIFSNVQYPNANSAWITSDQYLYHPESGEFYWQRRHEDKTLGEKWRNNNYEMHVGSIYGLPTKIIACLSALIFGMLPISGFLIWWGRQKKRPKPKP